MGKVAKIILGVVLVVLVVGFTVRIVAASRASGATEVTVDPIAVQVVPVTRRTLADRVETTGVVRPRREVEVFTQVPGRIERILCAVGDPVRAGQVLAVVEHRTVSFQFQQASAQAQAAAAGIESARANLESARLAFERARTLRGTGSVAPAEFERAEQGFRAAQAGLRVAEGQAAVARAATGVVGESLRNSRITTPIDGVVTRRRIDVGAQVSPAQPLFQVQDATSLKLEGSVGAEDFLRLRIDQPVRVTVDDLAGRTFTGHVATLSPTLDPQTRRALVELAIDPQEGLMPNMFAHVQVDVGERTGVLAVPAAAVMQQSGQRSVFVVRNGRAALVRPTLGPGDGDFLAVLGGLNELDQVVIVGQGSLTDGAAVSLTAGAVPVRASAQR